MSERNNSGNDNAYPLFYNIQGTAHVSFGLTKRERFAMAAMQGYCTNPNLTSKSFSTIAYLSWEQADALLAALEEGEK